MLAGHGLADRPGREGVPFGFGLVSGREYVTVDAPLPRKKKKKVFGKAYGDGEAA